jgi:uroporphyrinogen III methyltransferase/synthase
VTFVTGHAVDQIDWDKVGHSETLVILMGLTTFPQISRELIARGRAPETPAMAVRWATRPDQETVTGTLATLPGLVGGMKPPATIIVGEVVRLRAKLDWYERLPLFGKRIVVTRAQGQADSLSARLAALGAGVIELPTIEIRQPSDSGPIERAIANLPTYDWLIFTSANGVKAFIDRLPDLRALRGKICAIGPATRAAIEALHLRVDLMGAEYVAESLVAAFATQTLEGKRILLPRAAVARDLVPVELAKRGAQVDVVEAYRTVPPDNLPANIREAFVRKPDAITFTSSSTVKNFAAAASTATLADVHIVSIGPVTSQTARDRGLMVAAQARVFTVDGLVEALLGLYTESTPPATANS